MAMCRICIRHTGLNNVFQICSSYGVLAMTQGRLWIRGDRRMLSSVARPHHAENQRAAVRAALSVSLALFWHY